MLMMRMLVLRYTINGSDTDINYHLQRTGNSFQYMVTKTKLTRGDQKPSVLFKPLPPTKFYPEHSYYGISVFTHL